MPETTPGTALICVEPQLDPRFVELVDQVQLVLSNAELRVIASDQDTRTATDELVFIGTLLKAVKAKQTEYAAPIESHLKAIKDTFLCLSAPLGEADRIIRDKIKEYRAEVQRKRDALAAIEAERLKLANMEAAANGGVHTQDLTPIVKPVVPTKMDSYTGMGSMVRERKWELLDFAAVPDDWKMLDTTKIGKAVRGGIGAIPGIRIYIQENLRVTPH